MVVATKQCSRCKETKATTEYWVRRTARTRDGLAGRCKECSKALRREWAAQNRGKEAEYNRARYSKRREHYIAKSAEWAAAHPDRARETKRDREAARRARKHKAFVERVESDIVYARSYGLCGVCGLLVVYSDFHVDHIIPLARGGEHSYANTQAAHPLCNIRKGARENVH